MSKSKVFFTSVISPERVVDMYKVVGKDLPGRVAVKIHSGEDGNQNYIRPEFMKKMVEYVKGTVVECNTAYGGARNTTEKHLNLLKKHKWSECFDVDLLDAEGPDLEIEIPDGLAIKRNKLGKNIKNYDSLLVLSHFKGHPMGGYGGALKQLSIGCASTAGKCIIHSADKTENQKKLWSKTAEQELFLKAMADAAGSVVRLFNGNAVYINMACNLSVDCDCCAVAEDPCMKDIGILSSADPVALDRACMDLIYNSQDPGKEHFLERVKSMKGELIMDFAQQIGYGSKEYDLVVCD